ncbi:hypothetical protein [Achromobacter aloeverae]|uniref:Uncharacterized protein n=1 Tax=Achromobacter aloeverae TaxID=1750518 RepID=A0A4Q1HI31_9BURK|nr:hypothetical protein [Achromobacter aloeverae]RXN87882.1 hypothetical protein C7R54_14950 [Achromobacter aloeverae]
MLKKTPAPRAMTGKILSILLGCGLGLNALAADTAAPAAALSVSGQLAQATQAQPAQTPPAQTPPAQTPPAQDNAPAKETPKEPAKEAPKPAAKETPKEPAKEAPKPAPKEAPKEPAKEAPKPAAKEAPKEPAKEAPKPAAKEAPKEAPKDASKDASKEAPNAPGKEGDKAAAAATPAADAGKDAARGPVVVEVYPPAKGAHQPQFSLGDDKARLDGRQLGLALGTVAKDKARGPMTPVAILVDSTMTLADVGGIATLAAQAGMKQVRFFVSDGERNMVTEVVPQAGAAFPRARLESEVMAAPKEPD